MGESMYPTLISSYFLFCEIQRGTYRSPKPLRQLKGICENLLNPIVQFVPIFNP
ncbi:hypothetical protein PL10110_360053 [Planktothrix agardhii]|nr:hypothetical protein PL10110_360053 [Planktothrix agardhii]